MKTNSPRDASRIGRALLSLAIRYARPLMTVARHVRARWAGRSLEEYPTLPARAAR